jgi:hypothetical protein
MSFPNKVCYEASTTNSDGVKFSVEECAEYVSNISYEDAWVKAHELAKQKAEHKLTNAISKVDKKDILDVIKLTGPQGCPGRPGNSAQIPSILNVKELNADVVTTKNTNTDNLNIFSVPIPMKHVEGTTGTGSGTWYPVLGGQFCLSAPIVHSMSKNEQLYVDLPPAYQIAPGLTPIVVGSGVFNPEITAVDSTPTRLVLKAEADTQENVQLLVFWYTSL